MSGDAFRTFAKGMALGLQSGSISVPYHLLRYYRQLKLSDTDVMLFIHLIGFKQQEMKDFPTIEELQERMGASADAVIKSLQKLMKDGFLTIDEEIDPQTDVQYERYNLTGLWEKLAIVMAEEFRAERQKLRAVTSLAESEPPNLFNIFEKEFGRPLSPMECETIAGWIDQDRYPEELILLALKEAVFAGKVHFRYIDRILLEWNRNRIHSIEDAKVYTQKFRSGGR
ncbi:DnaD domain-containing protein [Paenibacillus apiarius]|uniref:DnaD domain-containing protein n=1 Tax=Paenibacillus apiarius TaxID=46240 RepID=A0ABT4DTP7_9BACL|nr:DnaD domain-containing protein [Paenibacillus apiarius]MBN3527566.1 DnaD domain-containing protein [Paenibacillus apiarius]MCY9515821.1 DnaD domain-containing protein [Paenibacillus apiarius]MCY9520731.1 DnaD domain-containing protein [Paenibacillus apiarius]MCY9553435.1 DnaD domain-containing protein [Paenibacillus apiarius]MCY9558041.1 DnaD domain-containing protein [Paenibacillus apiarius]